MPLEKEDIRKILFITLSNLGDVVLTLPVLDSLVSAFPAAEIHVISGESGKHVFLGHPKIKGLQVYNKRAPWREKRALLWRVRRERFDLIVDLRYSLLGLLGGARRRSRYRIVLKKKHRRDRHLAALRGLAPPPVSRREAPLHMQDAPMAREIGGGVAPAVPGPSVFLKVYASADPLAGEPLAEGQRWVAAAVGSKSDIKKWPVEHYAALLDRLVMEKNCRIVLVGDEREREDAKKVAALMKARPLDLTGRTDFKALAGVLQKVSLLVTNDSAPLHVADALGTPALAIFGPTDPRKYGPRLSASRALQRLVFCAPCEKAQCRYRHECMKELGADEAYAAAARILDGISYERKPRILIVRLDRIGDVVLSLPAIAAVRNRFPSAHISVMCRPYTCALLEGHPLIDEVIPYFYERKGRHRSLLGNWRFVREIVKRKFDIAFILHPSYRSHLVPFMAGIPYRIGLDSHAGFLLTSRVVDRRSEGKKHESDYTMDIVRAFGVEPVFKELPSLPVFADESVAVEEMLARAGVLPEERFFAVHPGASCPSKRWPKEKYAELIKKLSSQPGCRAVVIGGQEDEEAGAYLARQAPGTLDLTGRLDLKKLAAFLKRCQALVSNDSGPVHIAAAVGTPTVTIFGRSQPGLSALRWKALGGGHEVVQKDVGCVVCLAHECTIGFECLAAVGVDEVRSKVESVLGRRKKNFGASPIDEN